MNTIIKTKIRTSIRVINVCLITLFLYSCHDSGFEQPPFSTGDVWSCYRDSVWDEIKIRNALIGLWQWQYIACVWSQDAAHSVIDSNLTIEFRSDSFLVVKQFNEIIQTSRWEIIDGDDDLFSIADDPSNNQLFGRILICEDRLIFNGSYIDICDNFFKRTN